MAINLKLTVKLYKVMKLIHILRLTFCRCSDAQNHDWKIQPETLG